MSSRKYMSYIISPAPSDKCVFLTCAGDMTLAEMATVLREVQGVLADTGWQRVLADVTALQTTPDTGELFDLAKLCWQNFPQSGRIALVARWDQSGFTKLLESLVRSVGMYLTAFVSEEQAEAWVVEKAKTHQRSAPDSLPESAAQSELSKGALPCHV